MSTTAALPARQRGRSGRAPTDEIVRIVFFEMVTLRQVFVLLTLASSQGLKRPVIIAPAQFGVPRDYASLKAQLETRGHTVVVAPLTRLSW